MSLEDITNIIREKLNGVPSFGARIKFDFDQDGVVLVDGTQNPPSISHEDGEAETTLLCTTQTFKDIVNKTQDPTMAFMTGALKIQGSMGYALKLASILGD